MYFDYKCIVFILNEKAYQLCKADCFPAAVFLKPTSPSSLGWPEPKFKPDPTIRPVSIEDQARFANMQMQNKVLNSCKEFFKNRHYMSISKTKCKTTNRAFGLVVCKVLGWDIDRLLVILLKGEPLSRILANSSESQNTLQGECSNKNVENLETGNSSGKVQKDAFDSLHCRCGVGISWTVEQDYYLDRFIPNRSAMDYDYAHYMLIEGRKIKENKTLHTLRGCHRSRVGSMAWNIHFLTTGGMDGMIVNNDIRIRSHVVKTYRGHRQEVCGLKWSTSGKQLASGGMIILFTYGICPRHLQIHQHNGYTG
ncbi:hypothetical protein GOBAR_AA00940 [Gossypium barbadense]|uniref:Anaphase-promoting complex subunit 4 WD40 domain-containing protein n=3 Tax=Gossypium TaxID=3633 RepID=A0A2P5YVR3_GOSBA|nr:hypothetical protein GOBAR_AA00940 [Gossypium barbadense]